MWLRRLEVQGFRCITDAALELSPGINVIHGRNGSGKTSLLEAVYLLGTGRSFRSREPDQAIQEGTVQLIVRGEIEGNGSSMAIALRRERGRTTIRRDGEGLRSATELSRMLPITLVTPDTHVEMLTSPKARRRWLDMTLFHVKPGFLELWKRYMKGIKHRNALLRRGAGSDVLVAWDQPLARVGEELDVMREKMFSELSRCAQALLETVYERGDSELKYQRGWAADCSLLDAFARGRDGDAATAMTRTGPHRADIAFVHGGHPIGHRFSRGQLKVWIGVLMLAQAMVIAAATGAAPVLLVDDFVTDLDAEARKHLLSQLGRAGCQLLVTTTDIGTVALPDDVPAAVFHVKHGTVQPA
jgi:DNA replication and repair protein RecF